MTVVRLTRYFYGPTCTLGHVVVGANSVAADTAEIVEGGGKRRIVCWPDRSPSDRYAMDLPDGADIFRAYSGPNGYRVLVPAGHAGGPLPPPLGPPVPAPPARDCGPRPEKPPFWRRWGKAAKRYRAELAEWERCRRGES